MKRTKLLRKIPLRRVSKRRAAESSQYSKLRREFLTNAKVCSVCPPGSYSWASDVHHKFKRGKYFLDTSTWIAVCRSCHEKIHANPKWAREQGFLK